MIKLAVAGSPITHSLSPLLHTTAYELLGIPASFVSEEVTDLNFGEFYFRAKESGYRIGINHATKRDFNWFCRQG